MNPFQMIMGVMPRMQNVMQQAQQMAQAFQNPQALVQNFFPNAPAEVRNDPNQLLGWLQQTGQVTPQMIQMAQQITCK